MWNFVKTVWPWFCVVSIVTNVILCGAYSETSNDLARVTDGERICRDDNASQRERLLNEHEQALDTAERSVWVSYDRAVDQVLASARMRAAHSDLPQVPYAADDAARIRHGSEEYRLFPAEVAEVRAAEARLEHGYQVLASMGRGQCTASSGDTVPFTGFQAPGTCMGSTRATNGRYIRSIIVR